MFASELYSDDDSPYKVFWPDMLDFYLALLAIGPGTGHLALMELIVRDCDLEEYVQVSNSGLNSKFLAKIFAIEIPKMDQVSLY